MLEVSYLRNSNPRQQRYSMLSSKICMVLSFTFRSMTHIIVWFFFFGWLISWITLIWISNFELALYSWHKPYSVTLIYSFLCIAELDLLIFYWRCLCSWGLLFCTICLVSVARFSCPMEWIENCPFIFHFWKGFYRTCMVSFLNVQ